MNKCFLACCVSLWLVLLCPIEPLFCDTRIAENRPRLMFATDLFSGAPSVEEVASRVDRKPYSDWYNRLSLESFHTSALSWLIRSVRNETADEDSLADSVIERMIRLPSKDGNFYNAGNLHRMSLAYDWLYCYPGFSEEEKRAVAGKMLAMAEKLIGRAGGREVIWGEEIFHNYCTNAGLAVGLAGLTLYRGPGDEQAGRLLRIAEDWFFERVFPGYELLEGGWHEGMAYGLNHAIQEIPIWVAAYRTATGIDWFSRIRQEQGGWLEGWFYFCLANLRPDYTFVRSGDMNNSRMIPDRTLRQALELIVSSYRNRYGKFLLDELEERLGDRALAKDDLWMPLIFYDNSLEAADYRKLPPSQVINPSRLGHFNLRSHWGPDATFVHFECGDYFGSHNHLDQGHFSIYYKGALAIDSGFYDHYTPHHKKYAYRSIAHNVILVVDPEEMTPSMHFESYRSAGGQRALDYYFNNSNYDLSVYWGQHRDKAYSDMAQVTAWEAAAGHDYVEGDLTAAYNGTKVTDQGARPKISRLVRRLLFVKPDVIAVFDEVDAVNADFRKKWLLHTIEEPEVEADGHSRITRGAGGLLLTPLFPADVGVNKIGGPGREFEVLGVNYPIEHTNHPRDIAEPGAWRLELIPGAPRKHDVFLNVMQTHDTNATTRFAFRAVKAPALYGAVSNGLALFFVVADPLNRRPPDVLNLPAGIIPGSRVFVAGVERLGVYRVDTGGTEPFSLSAGAGGVLTFESGKNGAGGIKLQLDR